MHTGCLARNGLVELSFDCSWTRSHSANLVVKHLLQPLLLAAVDKHQLSLQRLSVGRESSLGTTLLRWLTFCPNLQYYELAAEEELDDDAMIQILNRLVHCTRLRHLKLDHFVNDLPADAPFFDATWDHLHTLSIAFGERPALDAVRLGAWLMRMRHLTQLSLNLDMDAPALAHSDSVVWTLPKLRHFHNCSNKALPPLVAPMLEYYYHGACALLSASDLYRLARHSPHLTHLVIIGCLDDPLWRHVAQTLRKAPWRLHHCDISGASLNATTILELVQRWPSLQHMECALDQCTDAASTLVHSMLVQCPQLQSVILNAALAVLRDDVTASLPLLMPRCSAVSARSLMRLQLGPCNDGVLRSLDCPALTELELDARAQVETLGMPRTATSFPRLAKLLLSEVCVDDGCLWDFVAAHTALTTLYLCSAKDKQHYAARDVVDLAARNARRDSRLVDIHIQSRACCGFALKTVSSTERSVSVSQYNASGAAMCAPIQQAIQGIQRLGTDCHYKWQIGASYQFGRTRRLPHAT